jgi:hypothetical protein
MRISPTKVVQLVESDPPQVVILDEQFGSEIAFTPEEADRLMDALTTFYPYFDGTYNVR